MGITTKDIVDYIALYGKNGVLQVEESYTGEVTIGSGVLTGQSEDTVETHTFRVYSIRLDQVDVTQRIAGLDEEKARLLAT